MSSFSCSINICLVGAGHMGGAMLSRWLADGYEAKNITVIDPNPSSNISRIIQEHGVVHFKNLVDIPHPDIIVIAIKPQIIESILISLCDLIDSKMLILSVTAGSTLAQLLRVFEKDGKNNVCLVRSIPNIPAMIGMGITCCVANQFVTKSQREIVNQILFTIGKVEWIDDEYLIDAITAISGSGPAYVFYLTEALVEAGKSVGLSTHLSLQLVIATIYGSGALLDSSNLSPEELRKKVTSLHGTTEAALNVLMKEEALIRLIKRAVKAATNRSRQLANHHD
ncbi:pyrroline-5-carboxylate reductase [Candidatus Endowatersipora endosymbiont of Watersipora subatra]|uniref:pyrroline-5-carboxylate reductase n=1 Tax=Candidatus Endowatersipora endosymbiont of Watersipora subatra TaxID=3077946 RepID=UPI00312C7709